MISNSRSSSLTVLQKWQNYTRKRLTTSKLSNSTNDERYNLAILELEVPYLTLGFENLSHFLLEIPNISQVLIDQGNVGRHPLMTRTAHSKTLNYGNKVVWFRGDDGKQIPGTVVFLVEIEQVLSAGLICDEIVGPHDKLSWFGTTLFRAPPGCGKILPVRELILQKDLKSSESGSFLSTFLSSAIGSGGGSKSSTTPARTWDSKKSDESGNYAMNMASQKVTFSKGNGSAPATPEVAGAQARSLTYPCSIELLAEDGLRVNDVVVWVTDQGTYDGIVMWLGQLREGGQIFAGVDFQQNVGDTQGTYSDHVLFRCKPKQGKFIPIVYLVKYEDFYDCPKPTPAAEISPKKAEISTNRPSAPPPAAIDDPDLIGFQQITINDQAKTVNPNLLPLLETEIHEFQIGDRVAYSPNLGVKYAGTIKWLGQIGAKNLAGIDFDKETGISGHRDSIVFPFECKPRHGGLAPLGKLEHLHLNFSDIDLRKTAQKSDKIYPNSESQIPARSPDEFCRPRNPDADNPAFLNTFIEPFIGVKSMGRSIGFHQGIQGKNNSCYIDATLFTLLAYTDAFDKILLKDDPEAEPFVRQLKAILRTDIANQLRRNYFCSAENVGILRKAMSGISSRIRNSEMADIEEFLYTLFEQGLKLDKFIHYSSGVSEFFHQILPNSKDTTNPSNSNHLVATTQKILETSMWTQDNLKFKCCPTPGLFIALPRSNGKFVQYRAVIPSLTIDLTHLLDSARRPCTICSAECATLECLECFDMIGNSGMSATAFCKLCFQTFHSAESRQPHKNNVRQIFSNNGGEQNSHNSGTSPNSQLELLGIICIRENHYVTFVKCGRDLLAPWVLHNSMADDGIPEIRDVPALGECLQALEKDPASVSKDWSSFLPEIQQILQDTYFCVYSAAVQNF